MTIATIRFVAIDDGGVRERFEAASLDAAIEQLRDWMSGAEFDASGGTVWYDAELYEIGEDADGDETTEWVHRETMAFEPAEPDCTHTDGHDWQSPYAVLGGLKENPGVSGHGGGVIIRECCAHCGRYKVRDTWAQRTDTGEQGLESLEYEDADEASESWIAIAKAKDLLEQFEPDDADEDTIARLYQAVIGRAPDTDDEQVSDIYAARDVLTADEARDVLTADEARAVIDVLG
jgi:hypothetical protein